MISHTPWNNRHVFAHLGSGAPNVLPLMQCLCFKCFKGGHKISKPLSDHLFRTPSLTGLPVNIIDQGPGISLSSRAVWFACVRLIRQKTAGFSVVSRQVLRLGAKVKTMPASKQNSLKGRAGCLTEKFGWRWWSALEWPLAATARASRPCMGGPPVLWAPLLLTGILSPAPLLAQRATCCIARPTPASVTDARRATRGSFTFRITHSRGRPCARRGCCAAPISTQRTTDV